MHLEPRELSDVASFIEGGMEIASRVARVEEAPRLAGQASRVADATPLAAAIRRARVVVVAAGMEGALPSVVGGLVEAPVIAVPTSIGYGASFQGLAALLAMLNSCASGVAVVNIDNGFGAGYMACAILRSALTGASVPEGEIAGQAKP